MASVDFVDSFLDQLADAFIHRVYERANLKNGASGTRGRGNGRRTSADEGPQARHDVSISRLQKQEQGAALRVHLRESFEARQAGREGSDREVQREEGGESMKEFYWSVPRSRMQRAPSMPYWRMACHPAWGSRLPAK